MTVHVNCPECDAEIHLDCRYEPDDPSYGADADGNRGRYVPGYAELDDSIPDECPECAHVYTQEELTALEEQAQAAVNKWEPPEPDYDDDRDSYSYRYYDND